MTTENELKACPFDTAHTEIEKIGAAICFGITPSYSDLLTFFKNHGEAASKALSRAIRSQS